MQGSSLLSFAIWVPIVAGFAVLTTGSDRYAGLARALALIGAILGFLVTLPLYTSFNPAARGLQFVQYSPWIEAFNAHYHLGIDGISLLLILLNSFTTVLVVIAGWQVIQEADDSLTLLVTGIRDGLTDAALRDQLTRSLAQERVRAPAIKIEHVAAVPKTAAGKAPLVKAYRPSQS